MFRPVPVPTFVYNPNLIPTFSCNLNPIFFDNQQRCLEGYFSGTWVHFSKIQWEFFLDIVGEEDCLYLDVFTPSVMYSAALPVIVYLPGIISALYTSLVG